MKTLENDLRNAGIKITPQRLFVYSILTEKPAHLCIEDVYKKVKIKLPAISKATVYTILNLFAKNKLIQSLNITDDRVFYDSRIDEHYHFLCNMCKSIFDLEIDKSFDFSKVDLKGHKVDNFQGYFYGECKNCREKREGEKK